MQLGKSRKHIAFNSLRGILLLTLLTCFCTATLASSAYLFFRDDLIGKTLARHAEMQREYETRIVSLRTQIDMMTSQQLLEKAELRKRLAEMLAKQTELGMRQSHLDKTFGAPPANKKPTVEKRATLEVAPAQQKLAASGLRLGSFGTQMADQPVNSPSFVELASLPEGTGFDMLQTLEQSLAQAEQAQIAELTTRQQQAQTKASKLSKILSKQGIRMPEDTAVGGPLIELKGMNDFVERFEALEDTLETLKEMQRMAKHVPHGSPTPGSSISSRYGTRRDPFTKRSAMHAGLDFRAKRGTPVYATGSGIVRKAGRNGGYGKLVEIDHGHGMTTRYAHLSRIKVKKGQRIKRGDIIGKVGSTGRSTGPHLHYEVRRKGRVLNPINYVRLEKALKPYL
ncbi:MAG: M23 family metallopeptidase [Pseudomonadota bacterium]